MPTFAELPESERERLWAFDFVANAHNDSPASRRNLAREWLRKASAAENWDAGQRREPPVNTLCVAVWMESARKAGLSEAQIDAICEEHDRRASEEEAATLARRVASAKAQIAESAARLAATVARGAVRARLVKGWDGREVLWEGTAAVNPEGYAEVFAAGAPDREGGSHWELETGLLFCEAHVLDESGRPSAAFGIATS